MGHAVNLGRNIMRLKELCKNRFPCYYTWAVHLSPELAWCTSLQSMDHRHQLTGNLKDFKVEKKDRNRKYQESTSNISARLMAQPVASRRTGLVEQGSVPQRPEPALPSAPLAAASHGLSWEG